MPEGFRCIDGNEAVASVAYRLSEVAAIYPITPASPMGEWADAWSAQGRQNLWGGVPEVVELQSEGGAAGALHGALQKGALATTFTASQGLLLMLPNMFKIAGELTPAVIHVAARAVATHALSIFADHSDVMAARSTGFAMLASASVQEAQDLATVAHAVTLRARVPFLHFFDGFRTSHELATIRLLADDDLRSLIDEAAIDAHRARRLTPERPILRGTAQNPDVFFQSREASNPFYLRVPGLVREALAAFAARTGRRYDLVDYVGAPDAERVLVIMGSGAGAAMHAVREACRDGERVGLLVVRLFRPFPSDVLAEKLPRSVRSVAVLDRTKEPGSVGEPLYLDVVAALAERAADGGAAMPRVIGGRYGLGSKEFTPAMARAVLDALRAEKPRNHFTVGIDDDVTHTSLAVAAEEESEPAQQRSALFFGLGSDGSVGAAKSTASIIAEQTELFAQGYFEYDSKKSGSVTVSHLRFGPEPIDAPYLVREADFVACHHPSLLDRMPVAERCKPGGTLLLASSAAPDAVFAALPSEARRAIVERGLSVYVVDAEGTARSLGMGGRINTIMQPCFFGLSGVLPRDRALDAIRGSARRMYAKRGPAVVERNVAAIDRALAELHPVPVPSAGGDGRSRRRPVPADAPAFVRDVTARLLAGEGNALPVSLLPPDGTYPTGTSKYEKRAIASDLPRWDPELCIDCGKCAIACPHAAIRTTAVPESALAGAPPDFRSKGIKARELRDLRLVIQVAPDDCTGCGVCADVCPARSKEELRHKALDMVPAAAEMDRERAAFAFYRTLPAIDPTRVAPDSVRGSQLREPLFEFSGACAGCGETPYLKLLTQLFGDRITIANATGCSSIYGANLPTTPWTVNAEGRGPAWANSLFEDNAEFGFGMRVAQDQLEREARRLLAKLAPIVGAELARAILEADQREEAAIAAQRTRIAQLRETLADLLARPATGESDAHAVRRLLELADELVRKSIWIVGGDGWAYDIGSAGLDHVLASQRDVNVLVLDTQVYSNTGGQASKATPRAAIAKFAASGKAVARKDLGLIASQYGHVYVAQVALGGNDRHTVRAFLEAEAWPGPSLIIAYSTCIAHGIDMSRSISHQHDAVRSGFWPLYRYHPGADPDTHPLSVDSPKPSIPLADFLRTEGRFAMLERSDPERARELGELAQADADERWRLYQQLRGVERSVPGAKED